MSNAVATNDLIPQEIELKDIDDVEPVGEEDLRCLAEVREVLKRHGKRERFGIALLHKHFDLSPDEMLMEETDVAGRVQTIKPVKKAEAGPSTPTIWALLDGENQAMMGCRQYCGKDVQGNHNSFHSQTRAQPVPATV